MAVTVELMLTETDIAEILAYKYAKLPLPDPVTLKRADIMRIVKQHFYGVSQSIRTDMTEEESERTKEWSRETIKGKGFRFA